MANGFPTLLVTGPPGVGKTAVAKEIGEQLFQAGAPHAVIDLDELARLRPAIIDGSTFHAELVASNLRAIWPNYLALGVERAVLARILVTAVEVDAYRETIPGAELTVCRVVAPMATIERRLRHREPGIVRSFLLDLAPKLEASMDALGVEDFAVDNGPGRDISEVAGEVLRRMNWPTAVRTGRATDRP